MAWEQLSVNRPHLVYIILGGFTSLFMLCSSVIKERLYIGEATVATLCGIIFGPHAANLIDPGKWGNTDQITLEFSRIVLVVQCFAVGVELPKYYMEKHWRSVTFLLVPVMTFGWLITSLFIWLTLHDRLSWLDSLVCAACVTATDPVLASSVVGKGKFAKRVPKHLRDLLSAESGCNDGMAFPFIYLGLYLIRYRPDAAKVTEHWICLTVLYECVFGATYGVLIGYLARKGVRFAHERDLIDRESFLVFYFVLALFCAGSGSILGLDDLLVGFACGVGFSNDGWFTEKTEESHVSNVIDLLINLAFFVYLGTIIPWEQYNQPDLLGTSPWRLVVIALLVLFFRRIPIMLALKPVIPDIKTWREALFAGHFGPIGVGAIFVAILARAEIETESTTPLAVLPEENFSHKNIVELIWPITTFLVITSILVHGSSIAVFTLGKHINTLTITMSYTQGGEENYNWMDRLPRIQSRSKSQASKYSASEASLEEKMPEYPSAVSLGDRLPRNFLRRQKEEDAPSRSGSRSRHRKHKSWDSGKGPGGPISQSAIAPARRSEPGPSSSPEKSESDTLAPENTSSSESAGERMERHDSAREEIYEEGNDRIIEDGDGNVLEVLDSRTKSPEEMDKAALDKATDLLSPTSERRISEVPVEKKKLEKLESHESEVQEIKDMSKSVKTQGWREMKQLFGKWAPKRDGDDEERTAGMVGPSDKTTSTRGPARAFRFGRTIIVENEDGDVIKKYDIPPNKPKDDQERDDRTRQGLQKMGSYLGFGPKATADEDGEPSSSRPQAARRASRKPMDDSDDDSNIRFTLGNDSRRMSKAEFIQQIQNLNPRSREEALERSDAPEQLKRDTKASAQEDYFSRRPSHSGMGGRQQSSRVFDGRPTPVREDSSLERSTSRQDQTRSDETPREEIPTHAVSRELRHRSIGSGETAAERRRRLATTTEDDSDDDGTVRVPPSRRRADSQRSQRLEVGDAQQARPRQPSATSPSRREEETPAERRRREAALGKSTERDSDEEETTARQPVQTSIIPEEPASPSQAAPSRGIRFAEQPPRDAPDRRGRRFAKK